MGIMSYVNQDIETIRTWLIAPTLVYFVTATYAYLAQNSNEEKYNAGAVNSVS